MKNKPSLTKVQIAAEFVLDDGGYMTPGTFGPVEMTSKEWAEFDLQAAIEKGVAASDAQSDHNRTV
jgi:hypothetical protein